MRKYEYQVVFEHYVTNVWAFKEDEAIILAQAEAIKNGKNHEVVSVTLLTETW